MDGKLEEDGGVVREADDGPDLRTVLKFLEQFWVMGYSTHSNSPKVHATMWRVAGALVHIVLWCSVGTRNTPNLFVNETLPRI